MGIGNARCLEWPRVCRRCICYTDWIKFVDRKQQSSSVNWGLNIFYSAAPTCSQRRVRTDLDPSGFCSATGPASRGSDSEQPAYWPQHHSPRSAGGTGSSWHLFMLSLHSLFEARHQNMQLCSSLIKYCNGFRKTFCDFCCSLCGSSVSYGQRIQSFSFRTETTML